MKRTTHTQRSALKLSVLAGFLVSAPTTGAQPGVLSPDEIVARAVDRVESQRESRAELAFESLILTTTENLDADLQVRETERQTYRQYAVVGAPYEELIARDGEPLDEDEVRDEADRKEAFIREVRERVARGEDPAPEVETRVEFDRDFVDRYRFTLQGEDTVDGHPSWILYMEPRSGGLPVRRSIDTALNNATGRLWIARDDFGLIRAEFELTEPVRFWGGILGTLRGATGRMEYVRVADGVWLPERLDVTIDLRILFGNIRRRIIREWSDYAPFGTGE